MNRNNLQSLNLMMIAWSLDQNHQDSCMDFLTTHICILSKTDSFLIDSSF